MQTTLDTPAQTFVELDYRENDGIEVSLLWNRSDETLTVFVSDARTNETFEIPVVAYSALEVFNHPYAYAHDAIRAATHISLESVRPRLASVDL